MKENTRLLLFTGSYASAEESGVQVFELNGEAGGTLTLLDKVQGITNPTFVSVDASGGRLYAIGEKTNGEGVKEGEVVSFAIDPQGGRLTELNRILTMPASRTAQTTTCHISRDPQNEYIIVCSYHGGQVGLVSMDQEGLPVRLEDTAVHTGQDKPHPHSAIFSPDGKFLFVSDLGLDLIRTYRINRDTKKLEAKDDTLLHKGAGPRHFVFHPDGKSAYVINELDSTVTSFLYDSEQGTLRTAATISTLPEDYPSANNACAEIALSADGLYLYGSNRGHDSIVVYAVDPATAGLTLVEHVSTRGGHPRHFALTPDGAYLVAANRDGNNLVVFSVDNNSGRLSFTGNTAELSKPVCVQPAYFPATV
ncbi:lactonase family protein [Paenibacillus sp. S150]|uniref:lactonase family protein n=1 Tax=Paenibacillus sp. S150 TaxID=2749826 RepID=UPI001C5660B9|nr:lactonase family protein [Paenibacillus sp. S150]MBW4083404.1 lactonase family protein [Paenibacillus sp. S150]